MQLQKPLKSTGCKARRAWEMDHTFRDYCSIPIPTLFPLKGRRVLFSCLLSGNFSDVEFVLISFPLGQCDNVLAWKAYGEDPKRTMCILISYYLDLVLKKIPWLIIAMPLKALKWSTAILLLTYIFLRSIQLCFCMFAKML